VGGWDKKHRVMQRYDLTACMYDMRYAEEQKAKFEVALKGLNINRDDLILDAGCGTGLLFDYIAAIAAKAKTVVGLDISRKLLFQANERAKKFQNIHLILADADRMPFKNDSFNLVFAFTLIQNMPDPAETLKEIKRVAKLEASILVTGLKKTFSLETYEELLRNAGLKVASLQDDALKCYVAICRKI